MIMALAPKKRFGQHFLTSPDIVQRIVDAAEIKSNEAVLEIGPGKGVLTGSLRDKAGHLYAVEVDRDLARALRESYAGDQRITIVENDFLDCELDSLIPGSFKVVANLPYYVAVPIIEYLLVYKQRIDAIVVMVQKEMAERMAAQPGNGDYGSLSVFIQYHARVEKLFDVPPSAFVPPPKVTSSVIRLTPHPPPVAVADETAFFAFVRKLFGTRRKMLRTTLRNMFGATPADLEKIAEIDLTRRPETLEMRELALLYDRIGKHS